MSNAKLKLLTKEQKAVELGISTDTVERLARLGRLRKIQISTRRVGFVEGEIPSEAAAGAG